MKMVSESENSKWVKKILWETLRTGQTITFKWVILRVKFSMANPVKKPNRQ